MGTITHDKRPCSRIVTQPPQLSSSVVSSAVARSACPIVGDANGDMWVFGYGSLMWHPDFPHRETAPALLRGYHRALCIYSTRYRGTADSPGLVLGLDRGGSCRGLAFRVASEDAEAVRDYLWEREMLGYAYRAKWLPVRTTHGTVRALTFVVDRMRHADYAGRLDDESLIERILRGRGQRGSSLEYLESTVRHLDELGIREGALHRLLGLARQRRASAVPDQSGKP